MSDLVADRNTPRSATAQFGTCGIAAGVHARIGGLAITNRSGYLEPASPAFCRGVIIDPTSDQNYDNSGGNDGDQTARFEFGMKYKFDKDASNPPTAAHIGYPGYASDDNHISYESEDGPEVGPIVQVDDDGVWVMPQDNVGNEKGIFNIMGSEQEIGAADTLTLYPGKAVYQVKSDGGEVEPADFLPTPQAGRMLIVISTSDANYLKLTSTDTNLKLIGDMEAPLKADDGIIFIGIGTSYWREMTRFIA